MEKNTDIFDQHLNPVLAIAEADDLEPLVEYLTKKFSEELTTHDAYKMHQPDHTKYHDIIAKEIRDMGGNSFANVFRGEGPSYHEIVCDVADKLGAPFNKKRSIEEIEDSIIATFLKQAWEEMSEEERQELLKEMGDKGGFVSAGISTSTLIAIFNAGGFKSYQLTLIVANQVAKLILGHGLKFATNRTLAKTMSILTGPVGMAISGVWAAIDLAGPSYKVTIPCVIHIAMLRKKLNAQSCTECGAIIPDTTAKFCGECGHKLS